MVTVNYEDLSEAFDFVSFGAPTEHRAYISMDTGTIHWISAIDPLDEDTPGDLETSDRYIEVPHKNELDLGRDLLLRFTAEELPDQYETVAAHFRRRGAYARVKELLASHDRLEKWYRFEEECRARALKTWCGENGIEVID